MKSWLIFLLLSLGRCSGDMNRSETLYQGYPFSVTIPLPDFKGSKHDVSQKEEVPFIVDVELTDGAILFHGIPLQDEHDVYHATIGEPEGEHFDIWIDFVVKERNESDVECGLHPAAVIDMGAHAFHEEKRTELYDTIKEISENVKYSMNLMKVRQPEEPEKNWLLHMMAPKSCSSGNFEPDVWETINRIEADSEDGILKIGQKKFGFRRTKEFTEHSGRIANAGGFPIDGRSIGTEEATTEPITTEAAATSTTVSPTTTTERTTTSTTTEPTTTSTTTERVTTSTTAKPTTTTEATTTSTTAKPTTTSTTERPAKFTSTELSTTSTTTMPSTERAVTIIRETDEALLHRTTEIPALTEEDVETVARADEYYPEALPKENSGASVARPLFAVIVLLALASAVAVFTIARARNVHRKTFVIGNASPEEINDIVVLGRDDAFH